MEKVRFMWRILKLPQSFWSHRLLRVLFNLEWTWIGFYTTHKQEQLLKKRRLLISELRRVLYELKHSSLLFLLVLFLLVLLRDLRNFLTTLLHVLLILLNFLLTRIYNWWYAISKAYTILSCISIELNCTSHYDFERIRRNSRWCLDKEQRMTEL